MRDERWPNTAPDVSVALSSPTTSILARPKQGRDSKVESFESQFRAQPEQLHSSDLRQKHQFV